MGKSNKKPIKLAAVDTKLISKNKFVHLKMNSVSYFLFCIRCKLKMIII